VHRRYIDDAAAALAESFAALLPARNSHGPVRLTAITFCQKIQREIYKRPF